MLAFRFHLLPCLVLFSASGLAQQSGSTATDTNKPAAPDKTEEEPNFPPSPEFVDRQKRLEEALSVAPVADKKSIEAQIELLKHNHAHWHRVQAGMVLKSAETTSSGRSPSGQKPNVLDPELLENEFLVQALRHPYTKGNFSWQVLAGAEMSNRNASFSSVSGYARFLGDTAFAPESRGCFTPGNVHGIVDISFSTIPVQDSTTSFAESKKALTGSVGLDWLMLQSKQGADGHRIQGGIAGRLGVQSIDGQLDDLSVGGGSGQEFWGVGMTIRTSPAFRYSDRNPMPYAYLTILWGEYDTLSGHAFTFDGVIRFVPDQQSELTANDPWGLFVGLRAVVNPDGDDDLRFQVGVQDGLALLKDIFERTTTLFGKS